MGARDHHHTGVPERVALRDGSVMRIRPMRGDDRPRLERMAQRCSPATLRLRFFIPVRHLDPEQIVRLADLDFLRNAAYAATREDDDEIRAVGRLAAESPAQAEIAFIVEDAYQGHGIATELLHHLVAFARERGYTRLLATMLAENHEMLEVFEHARYPMHTTWEGDTVRLRIDIAEARPGA